ncbi:MAG: GntR family transcriptional regulator [Gaiellales bacterium]
MSSLALTIDQPDAQDARSQSERADYAIRELIVTLELEPGSVVSERSLMGRLQIGRTPVREALQRLANERLVEVYPRRGMFVSGVEVHDLRGLSEVRATLEPACARLAAERADVDDHQELDALLEALAHLANGGDERTLIELDQRIHRTLYRCAHNPFLEETLTTYYVLALRIWFLALGRVTDRLDDAVRSHRRLLEAVRHGDGDQAEAAMREHVADFERAIRAVL